MVFPVEIINHVEPEVTITNADSAVPPITYEQIKQSLGTQVYKVDNIYMYSQNINQLMSVLQYQRFDVSGDQDKVSIASTIDPYAGNTVAVDLKIDRYPIDFILNGNSNFSIVILPETTLQIKFFAYRITNSFGGNLEVFKEMEELANKPDFFENYGSPIDEIDQSEEKIMNDMVITKPAPDMGMGDGFMRKNCESKIPYILMVVGLGMGIYVIRKK